MKTKIIHTFSLGLVISALLGATEATAAPQFVPTSSDLMNAMATSLATVETTSLTQVNNRLFYSVDDFNASIDCVAGWQDVSEEYNDIFTNQASYRYCQGEVVLMTDVINAVPVTMEAKHLLVASNGQFFGELTDLPSVPFGGLDKFTTQLNNSSIRFAMAKGAIIEQFTDLAVGLPDQRLMAYFHVEMNAGGSMAITDAMTVASGESAYVSVVLDWRDPLYYTETDVFTQGPFDELPFKPTGQGISWHGRLGFEADYPLWRDERWQGADFSGGIPQRAENFQRLRYEQKGHVVLAGEVAFSPYPITLSGLINVNMDASEDGFGGGNGLFDSLQQKITETASDTQLAANGALSISLGDTALALSVDLGEASLSLNTAKKQFSFWGESVNFFENNNNNWIGKILDGIKTPQFVAFGMVDIDNGKIARFDQSFAADIRHNGFVFKGQERLAINVPDVFEGLTVKGKVGYLGADVPFILYVSTDSCSDVIEQATGVSIGGYAVNKLAMDLCEASQRSLIPIDATVFFGGQSLVFSGLTQWNKPQTLTANGSQVFDLRNGTLTSSAVTLKDTGIAAGNAVVRYGRKTKAFAMGLMKGLGEGFASKLSNWSVNDQLHTGKVDLGSAGRVASQYFKIGGNGRFAAKVSGNDLSVPYTANLTIEYCAKFLGKKDCKRDSLPTLSGHLDLDGCYRTPKMEKSLKILGKRIKFDIPSRRMCMF